MGELARKLMGIDTSDATASAADILSGKTAYAGGTKITGTLVNGKKFSILSQTPTINGDNKTVISGSSTFTVGRIVIIAINITFSSGAIAFFDSMTNTAKGYYAGSYYSSTCTISLGTNFSVISLNPYSSAYSNFDTSKLHTVILFEA